MTTQTESSIMYNVIVVNLYYIDYEVFIKGIWDGESDESLIMDNGEIDSEHLLIKPPLIIDNIDHTDEINIREYVHHCRYLHALARVRAQSVLGNINMYPTEIQEYINDHDINEAMNLNALTTRLDDDIATRIISVNERTLTNKTESSKKTQNIDMVPIEYVQNC